jgi:hypothetical protein
MRAICILTLSLLLSSGFAWGQQAAYDKECTAIVQGQTAKFIFQLPEKQTWTWNMKETDDNSLEYKWEIGLEGGAAAGTYNFGVYLFKYPGAREATGGITQLLSACQTSVWDESLRIRKDLIIQSAVEGRRLVISISDNKTFAGLFSQKPAAAYCRVRTPYDDINYQNKVRIDLTK